MFLALNGSIARAPWPEFARLAARTGWPGVDVSLGPAMAAGADATIALLKELRLKPAVLSFPVEFRKDDAAFEKDLAKLEPQARFAAAIGCPRMITWIMSSSPTPKAELRAIYKKRFTAAAAVLARSHVRLGLEFLGPLHIRKAQPYEFIWRMSEMLEFARECGPNVGLLLDSWHWYHAGGTLSDIVAAGKDGVVHVHFNDAARQAPVDVRDNERLFPGQGVVDLPGFLKALQKIGYADGVSVEVLSKAAQALPPAEGARMGFATASAVFRKAGVPWNA